MQQSLCHLYFLTVMEHLWNKIHFKPDTMKLANIVKLMEGVQTALETAKGGDAVLLWVELQAVVQVLIQQLATHFNPSLDRMLGDVKILIPDINKLE